MGVVTTFYAFETARFDALRRARRIAALSSSLVKETKPPIAIAECIGIDKVQLRHLALLLDASMPRQLRTEHLKSSFFQHGLRRIAHPHAEFGYWDPFYAVEVFDKFDLLVDRHMRNAERKTIRRVGNALIQKPSDPFQTAVWAYRTSDLSTVFAVVRKVMDRVELDPESIAPVKTADVIDAFFALIGLLHRAFEPLTPAGRRGNVWTIVYEMR